MSDLVSIIIPVYNTVTYLDACLQSVQSQTYKKIEVIIINDGSTDESEEIIKKYTNNDYRFRYFYQENQGLGYTRNRGVSLSNGEYIFFLDSDDTIPKNAISLLVSAIKRPEVDYAVGKVLRFNSERKYVPIRHLEFNLYKKSMVTSIEEHPELIQDSIACNKLWKKEFIQQHKLSFEIGKYYEDLFFTLKAAVLAEKIAVITEPVYYWRVRNNDELESITQQQMKLNNTLDRLTTLKKNRRWLIEQQISPHIIKQHDLKSLIDVLRLHVIKYALIDKRDREIWKEEIQSFIYDIPDVIARNLPSREKIIYNFIINKNYNDLETFSKVFTNTEKAPIVHDQNNRLIIKGEHDVYDITNFLKPTVVVENIDASKETFVLSGQIIIPKASRPVTCSIIAEQRNEKKQIVIGELKLQAKNINNIYKYEKQSFQCTLVATQLSQLSCEQTFDLYLQTSQVKRPRARIRASSTLKHTYNLSTGKNTITFYRTNYGNLSIKTVKKNNIKTILRRIKSIITKN